MKSTRLPGKILLPIPLQNGKPLLKWITDELKYSKLNGEIILATSTNEENDVLQIFCDNNSILCYRGDEDNVVSRFIEIVRSKKYDCVVRLTADNPILDVSLLDDAIGFHLKSGNDYTKTEILPLGMNFEIVSGKAFLELDHNLLSHDEKEHVTLYFKNKDGYKNGIYIPKINCKLRKLRLTIDYPSDFALVSAILSTIVSTSPVGIKLIEELYQSHQWLFETNTSNIQKKHFFEVHDEVKEAMLLLESYDYKRAAKILGANAQ